MKILGCSINTAYNLIGFLSIECGKICNSLYTTAIRLDLSCSYFTSSFELCLSSIHKLTAISLSLKLTTKKFRHLVIEFIGCDIRIIHGLIGNLGFIYLVFDRLLKFCLFLIGETINFVDIFKSLILITFLRNFGKLFYSFIIYSIIKSMTTRIFRIKETRNGVRYGCSSFTRSFL